MNIKINTVNGFAFGTTIQTASRTKAAVTARHEKREHQPTNSLLPDSLRSIVPPDGTRNDRLKLSFVLSEDDWVNPIGQHAAAAPGTNTRFDDKRAVNL